MQTHNNKIKSQRQLPAYVYGDRIDIIYTSIPPSRSRKIYPLNEREYIVLSTGEVKNFMEKETSKSKSDIMVAMHQLRRIINANYDPKNKLHQLFITLTYAENMTDPEKLYVDFHEFIRKAKRHFRNQNGAEIDYICVREPQERGAWHCHVLIKSDRNIYIKPDQLRWAWPHGRCKAERVKDVESAGAYLTAYFCNDESRKKLGRIALYPKGFKFYTTSKGIVKPEKKYISLDEIEKQGDLVYEKSFDIELKEGMKQTVVRRTYRMNEDKPQEKI